MIETVRVLVVEDNPADVELIKEYLPGMRPVRFQFESVPRLSEALARLKEKAFDLLLIDLGLPDSQGIDTFLNLQKAAPETAAIILTGNNDEEMAVMAVRNGAQDYLIKGEINGTVLLRVARYAIERKRAEEALRESEGKLKALFGILPVGVGVLDKDRNFLYGNAFLEAMMELSAEELSLGYFRRRKYLRPDGTPMPAEEIASERALKEKRAIHNIETGSVKDDGQTIWMNVSAVPVDLPEWRVVVVSSDITKRKENEKRQVLAMQVLAALNRRNDIGLLVEDILHLIKNNTGFDAIAIRLKEGYDYPYYVTNGFSPTFVEAERFLCERDLSGKAVLDSDGNPILECMCGNILRGRFDPAKPFFTERGSFWTNCTTDLLASTTEKDRLARTRNRCNGEGYESVALIPIRSEDEVIGLLQLNDHRRGMLTLDKIEFFEEMGASIGIAVARKRAAAAIESSLREKEVLIKEIYHRVKNNMQIVSSLLNLQSAATSSEECRGILKEARTRIRAMSLIHEKLYQSHNLMNIDMGDYTRNLADHLFQVYVPHSGQIRLEMEFEKVLLDINSSVPCGLLLNELISNSLKYAFPEGRKGILKIGLRRGIENMVELRVEDDGVGFPEEFDFRNAGTFGFQIVNMLVSQLDATIELDRTNGAAFTVMFRELSYKPRL
jgi:PAS domain S-box-containing protein